MRHSSLNLRVFIASCVVLGAATGNALAQAKVFSGPQPGEKTTSFKTLQLAGDSAGKERDLIAENKGAATVLVFVHGLERSMTPVMTLVDEYGSQRKDRLKTEYIFLSADRLSSQQRLPVTAGALKLQAQIGLSADGAEGPGNYGLNKECLLTIVVAKENKVTANFALVQPGFSDVPRIISAIAKTIGDENPPTAEALQEKRGGGYAKMQRGKNMEKGRDAAAKSGKGGELPGAAPTDEKLVGLLRRFIQKTNDESMVDRVLAEVAEYVKGNETLTKQAVDGWTRVLHLKYGTEYAQKAGQAWLEKLKK